MIDQLLYARNVYAGLPSPLNTVKERSSLHLTLRIASLNDQLVYRTCLHSGLPMEILIQHVKRVCIWLKKVALTNGQWDIYCMLVPIKNRKWMLYALGIAPMNDQFIACKRGCLGCVQYMCARSPIKYHYRKCVCTIGFRSLSCEWPIIVCMSATDVYLMLDPLTCYRKCLLVFSFGNRFNEWPIT